MFVRIQSLYLGGVIIALIAFLFLPFVKYFLPNQTTYIFYVTKMVKLTPAEQLIMSYPIFLIILTILILLFTIVALFLFKNRILQMRVVAVAFLFNAILIGSMYYFADKYEKLLNVTAKYQLGTLLPILALILMVLANKAIRKDEIKVRQSQRLR